MPLLFALSTALSIYDITQIEAVVSDGNALAPQLGWVRQYVVGSQIVSKSWPKANY